MLGTVCKRQFFVFLLALQATVPVRVMTFTPIEYGLRLWLF